MSKIHGIKFEDLQFKKKARLGLNALYLNDDLGFCCLK